MALLSALRAPTQEGPWSSAYEEIGVADEEAVAIIVGVHEPAGHIVLDAAG